MSDEIDLKPLSELRAAFPASNISKLPRLNCTDCSNSQTKVCGKHKKIKCDDCGNWISEKHIHLDYVGHAEVTSRLLDVDATWSWEPLALTPMGLPAKDEDGGLWIKLTVAGVTRLGYGDAQGKRGPNGTKELIGDAIRNAAMRFGVALELWAKSDLDQGEATPPQPEAVGAAIGAAKAKTDLVAIFQRSAADEQAARRMASELWTDMDLIDVKVIDDAQWKALVEEAAARISEAAA